MKIKNKRYYFFVLFITILFLTQCTHKSPEESEKPSWNVDLEVPLYTNTFMARDLLGDSLFSVGDNSIYTFDTTYSVDRKEIDEIKIDSFSTTTNKQLGNFHIESFSHETDPILLEEVLNLPADPTNTEITVPQGESFPEIVRSISFEKFNTVTFSQGEIIISIQNNLPLELGSPINIEIIDANNNNKILETDKWDGSGTGIKSGDVSRDTLDLSGVTLPKDIEIIINGVLCGSEPGSFTDTQENRESSFQILTSTQNLKASSAEAVIPSQTIENNDIIPLISSGKKIKKAKFKTATLDITLDNNTNLDQKINLKIPDIVNDSETDTFTTDISANRNSSVTESNILDQYKILLDDINNQELNYKFEYILDSDGEIVQLDSQDEVTSSIEVYGDDQNDQIIFETVEGNINKEEAPTTQIESISEKIETFPEELEGIELSDVRMKLNLGTNIGAKLGLDFQIEASNSKGETASLIIGKVIDPRDSTGTNMVINIEDAEKLINILPNKFSFSGNISVFGNDVILTDEQYLEGNFNINIPFELIFTDNTNTTVELDPEKVENQEIAENIVSVTINYHIINTFDIGSILNLYAARDSNYFGSDKQDTLINNLDIDYDSEFTSQISVIEKNISLFSDSSLYVKPQIELKGKDTSRVLQNDSLKVNVWGKITGKIDTSVYEGN